MKFPGLKASINAILAESMIKTFQAYILDKKNFIVKSAGSQAEYFYTSQSRLPAQL
nr:hypothetical protein [Candidatus Cloacimonadota bacterium]